MLISITLSLGVSAQRKENSREHKGNSEEREEMNEYSHEYHPRVYNVPLNYGLEYNYPYYSYPYYSYPYYGYPYFDYPYYGYPYYGYPFWNKSSHNSTREIQYSLSLQIHSIRMDYRNKIKQVRHDNSLSHSQKVQKIDSLKNERSQSIIDAEKDFANQLNKNNQNAGIKNNQNTDDGHSAS